MSHSNIVHSLKINHPITAVIIMCLATNLYRIRVRYYCMSHKEKKINLKRGTNLFIGPITSLVQICICVYVYVKILAYMCLLVLWPLGY